MTAAKGKSSADARRLEMLETTPATRPQVGAILGEFRRLSIRRRDERLSISAALVKLDDLDSTWDLTMGQAGKLLHILRATKDRTDLNQRVEAAKQERQMRHEQRATHRFDDVLGFIAGILRGRPDL